jgi:hypothetical protein
MNQQQRSRGPLLIARQLTLFCLIVLVVGVVGQLFPDIIGQVSWSQLFVAAGVSSLMAWWARSQWVTGGSDLVSRAALTGSLAGLIWIGISVILRVDVDGIAMTQPWDLMGGPMELVLATGIPVYIVYLTIVPVAFICSLVRDLFGGPEQIKTAIVAPAGAIGWMLIPDVPGVIGWFAPPNTLSSMTQWTWSAVQMTGKGSMIAVAMLTLLLSISVVEVMTDETDQV